MFSLCCRPDGAEQQLLYKRHKVPPEISPLRNKNLQPLGAKQQTPNQAAGEDSLTAGSEIEISLYSWGKDKKTL